MGTNATATYFIKIIEEHKGIIQKVCSLYRSSLQDRQDLFQEIVAQLWKSFPSYRGEAKISTWMYRVALNTAISDLRQQQRKIQAISLEGQTLLNYAERNDELPEQWQQVQRAIKGLSEVEKAIVMLYLDEKTYEEMEEVLGITTGTLRVKMNRVKEKLRKIVANLN